MISAATKPVALTESVPEYRNQALGALWNGFGAKASADAQLEKTTPPFIATVAFATVTEVRIAIQNNDDTNSATGSGNRS